MTAAAAPTFTDFMREKVGPKWVLARRTQDVVRRYGGDVACLSAKRYSALEAEYERTTLKSAHGDGPAKFLSDAAPELLRMLKQARECIAWCRCKHPDAQTGEGFPIEMFIDAVIAKAEGRTS